MTQWRDRILEFIPNARIGKIQQNTVDIEDKDIVIPGNHVITLVEPIDSIKEMYSEKVNGSESNSTDE